MVTCDFCVQRYDFFNKDVCKLQFICIFAISNVQIAYIITIMNKLLFSLLGFTALQSAAQQRPNVIVILADDLGYGDLECYNGTAPTPAVNRLAQSGIRFTDAHAVASTSTPSRYGLLTGCYPFRKSGTDVAAGNAGMIIKPNQYTLADVFHNQGYATAAIGKWHLGLGSATGQQDWNGTLDQHTADLGFDYSYIMAATADRVPCVFIENGRVANYDPSAPISVNYNTAIAGGDTYGSTAEKDLKLKSSHGHNQGIVNGIGRIGYMKGGGDALWQDENIADSIARHSLDFITAHKDEPFFMYIGTNDIHVPRWPHERFRGTSPLGLRGDAILQFDWTVNQITTHLEELGLRENTLIILTSDNGPVLDDGYVDQAENLAKAEGHRPGGIYRGGKYSSFEAGSIVPFIVSWPARIEGGKESHALVSQIDISASMAALLGVDIPDGQCIDSRNQLQAWLGETTESAPFNISMSSNRSLVVRTQRWKYISPSDGAAYVTWGTGIETGYKNIVQLYDMLNDPGETINVAEQYPEIVQEIESRLASVRRGAGDPVEFQATNDVNDPAARRYFLFEAGNSVYVDIADPDIVVSTTPADKFVLENDGDTGKYYIYSVSSGAYLYYTAETSSTRSTSTANSPVKFTNNRSQANTWSIIPDGDPLTFDIVPGSVKNITATTQGLNFRGGKTCVLSLYDRSDKNSKWQMLPDPTQEDNTVSVATSLRDWHPSFDTIDLQGRRAVATTRGSILIKDGRKIIKL